MVLVRAFILATIASQCNGLRMTHMKTSLGTDRWMETSHFGWLGKPKVMGITSRSDTPGYTEVVDAALNTEEGFKNFKTQHGYTKILEHVHQPVGESYRKVLESMSPDMMKPEFFDELRKQNQMGNPATANFPSPVGTQSPTMLRYWKVVSDINWLFGDMNGKKVADIGVGYGGLSHAMFVRFPSLESYTYADLPVVEKLALKVLGKVRPQDADKIILYNSNNGTEVPEKFDLCVSNYAFSELNDDIAELYVNNLLAKCSAGYLTWNPPLSYEKFVPMIEDATKQLVTMSEEIPNTGIKNKLFTWGTVNSVEDWMAAQKKSGVH